MSEIDHLLKASKRIYERAYERTRKSGLHDLFGALASGRVILLAELEREMEHLERDGHVASDRSLRTLKSLWKEVRNPFWMLTDRAILQAVHRNERSILAVYERHLRVAELPPSLAEILSKQCVILRGNLRDIELFRQGGLAMA